MSKITISALFIVLIGSVVAGPPEPPSPEVKAAIEACKGVFPNVKDDIIMQMCTPSFTTEDKDVKCFGKCLGENLGYVDASGKLQGDKIKAKPPHHVDAAQVDSIIQECGSKTGADACDTSYMQWKCMMSKIKM